MANLGLERLQANTSIPFQTAAFPPGVLQYSLRQHGTLYRRAQLDEESTVSSLSSSRCQEKPWKDNESTQKMRVRGFT